MIEFFSRDVREPDAAVLEMMASVGSQVGQFVERRRAEEERARLLARERRQAGDVVGGIQITGSHNPPEFNGFKLGLKTHSIYGADIQHIYTIAEAGNFPRADRDGTSRNEEVIGPYIDDIVARVGQLPTSLKVVLDAGNGAGALVAPMLFERLGLSARCLFCESDGTFPNHHPDPTVPSESLAT